MCNYIKNLYILLPEKIANIKSKYVYAMVIYNTQPTAKNKEYKKKKEKKHGGKKKEIKK